MRVVFSYVKCCFTALYLIMRTIYYARADHELSTCVLCAQIIPYSTALSAKRPNCRPNSLAIVDYATDLALATVHRRSHLTPILYSAPVVGIR